MCLYPTINKKLIIFPLFFIFCALEGAEQQNIMDYKQLKIRSYKYWDLYLHENQCYLGRVFVQLKDAAGVDDFLAIEGEVREEFFAVGNAVKAALYALFRPDKMNYAALSNTSPVIHMHIVPRYKEPRAFAEVLFQDKRWGQNYAPYDRSFIVDNAVLMQIRDAIETQL
jgi:diadenosine tetraphosphate (Ap4A) HIT family hydrolase